MASGSVHVKILQRQLRLFGVAHDRLLQTLNVSVKTSTVTLSPGSLLSSTLSSSSTMNLDEAIPPKEVTLHFAVLWSWVNCGLPLPLLRSLFVTILGT
jgi:hypothetical protein